MAKCWCSLAHCGLPLSGGQLAVASLDIKKTLFFPGAGGEKLLSAEDLCNVLYSGLGETSSVEVSYDLMIKC